MGLSFQASILSVHVPPRHYFDPLKLSNFDFLSDPDPAFRSNADPNLASKNNADLCGFRSAFATLINIKLSLENIICILLPLVAARIVHMFQMYGPGSALPPHREATHAWGSQVGERSHSRGLPGSVPDPHVFGPPGSGSFYHQAKIVRKTLIPTVL